MRSFLLSIIYISFSLTIKGQKLYVERSTDVLSITPVLTGLCVAFVNEDKEGLIELGLSTGTCLVVNYALEALIHKDRPDKSSAHSFPSTHSAVSFTGATFLMKRYGWKFGIPAYAISTYVAWGRTYSKKHDVWDVISGAALGTGCALIYSHKRFKGKSFSIAPTIIGESRKGVTACLVF